MVPHLLQLRGERVRWRIRNHMEEEVQEQVAGGEVRGRVFLHQAPGGDRLWR